MNAAPSRAGASLALACLLVPSPASVRAAVPLPVFPDCGLDGTFSACPGDMEGKWDLSGFVPEPARAQAREAELAIGSGQALDEALRVTTGRWDAAVAVLDSGIEWDEGDLVHKIQLNAGELPPPLDAGGATYPEPRTWDPDGNGLLNVADYASDPRLDPGLGDPRAASVLDPSDLIAAFSDGVDDDANGYVDDIAGWDFFSDDNDPGADNYSFYGDHGTGVLKDAGAEGRLREGDPNSRNGSRIGTCPSCALIPIRIGDSFISVGHRIAEAVTFAVDHGAASVAMATGGMTHTPMTERALRYAWDRGVVAVGAAGDETSPHHNFPSFDPTVLYVHSIGPDAADWEDATSFLRFVNCNNYGSRMDLVAGSSACATGATAQIAGGAALLVARGREVGMDPPLSAAEVGAILRESATDVDVPESRGEEADPELFPSRPGWDPFFGWGRMHLGAAVDRIGADASRIPPVAFVEEPRWAQFVDPSVTPEIEVVAAISGRGGDLAFTLEYAPGDEPDDGDWLPIASGTVPEGQTTPGVLATWDLAGIPPERFDPTARPAPLDRNGTIVDRAEALADLELTLRLRVEDPRGNASTTRRSVYVHHDPDLLPGFPVRLGSSAESSPHLADLDGDLDLEIVLATSDGRVHAFGGDGSELPGFPAKVGPLPALDPSLPGHHRDAPAYAGGAFDDVAIQDVLATAAVGDLEGDGVLDVVVATLSGRVYAFDAGGAPKGGFPAEMDRSRCDQAELADDATWDCGFFASPVLWDLDGDGTLEIVQAGMDQRVYVFRWDGSPQPGWPVDVNLLEEVDGSGQVTWREGRRIVSTPSVGDIDGDGEWEVVLGTNQVVGSDITGYGVLYALRAGGEADPRGPFAWESPTPVLGLFAGALPYVGEGVPSAPALADLDGDGAHEVFAAAVADTGRVFAGDASTWMALDATSGNFGPGSDVDEPSMLMMITDPALADMNGDGVPDLLAPASGIGYGLNLAAWWKRYEHQHGLAAYDGATGASLPGFPRQMEDVQFFATPAVADVSGDGAPEAIHGSGAFVTHAWDAEGVEPAGWPKVHGGWQLASPAVGDVDGDGWLDVVVATREGLLFAWRTRGRADAPVQWAGFHHDARNTGNVDVEIPLQPGPAEDPPPGDGQDPPPGTPPECGCAAAQDGSPGSSIAAALVAVVLGRRRRGGRVPG